MKSTEHRSRRLVLKRSPADDEVQQFADELGWPRRFDQPADLERRVHREIAWAAGPAVSLHYLDDPVSQHSYVVVWGGDRQIVESLASVAEERLGTWTTDELLAAVDNARDSMSLAVSVIRAGLGSPDEFDDRFFRRIKASMSNPDRRVREAAFYATAYTAWPQYLPLLEDAARTDPDRERRRDAQILVDSFRSKENEP